jgi:putative peptidoglycan lipid II flippase
MSSIKGSVSEINGYLRVRLEAGLHKIAFFIIPSVCAFIFLGNLMIAAILQSGKFQTNDVNYVWIVLIGSTIGLLASTMGRLYSSTFYSLKDTKTPLKFAFIRVFLTTALGYLFAFPLPKLLNLDPSYGTAGLTASAGLSGWVEFYLLRQALNKQIGKTNLKVSYQLSIWFCAIIASLVSLAVKHFIHIRPLVDAIIIFSFFGVSYFAVAYLLKIEEAKNTIDKIISKIKRHNK